MMAAKTAEAAGRRRREAEKTPEDSIGVCTDTEKGGMPEVQQAGKSDNDLRLSAG